jgi:hypothetical protein
VPWALGWLATGMAAGCRLPAARGGGGGRGAGGNGGACQFSNGMILLDDWAPAIPSASGGPATRHKDRSGGE